MCGDHLKGLTFLTEWLTVIVIHFENVDVHYVQTSGNTFNGIDNNKS